MANRVSGGRWVVALARLLTLAACLPLLVPTGFCVCKAGDGPRPIRTEQGPPAATAPTTSGCCAHRHGEADAEYGRSGEPARDRHPTPADDSHQPGCPASTGVGHVNWVEPVTPAALDLAAVAVVPFLPLEVVVPAPSPVVPVSFAPAAPLYLSHCALVI